MNTSEIMHYKEYFATIHYSANDDIFHGKLIGITDLVSFEGASVKELRKAFHEAVDDYLETLAQSGNQPKKSI
jgi:predicted HicB family RNase H-like nuclease